MADRSPALSLPEELLLICTDPTTGRLRRPHHLHRALGGAVLTELLLAKAITVDGRRITAVRPLPTGDPFADQLLADLSAAHNQDRPLKLDRWVRRASSHADRPYLATLTSRGLLTSHRRHLLGLIPVTVYTATRPGWPQEAAARILAQLPPGTGPSREDPRTLHLAALATTVRLDRRLFTGPTASPTRHHLRTLVRTTPIPDAVRRVISSDDSAVSGA